MCGEERNRHHIPAVGNTGKRVVPSQEGSDHSETATRLRELVGYLRCAVVHGELSAGKHQEGQVEGEKQHEEHDR